MERMVHRGVIGRPMNEKLGVPSESLEAIGKVGLYEIKADRPKVRIRVVDGPECVERS
jgi:hypothetical protein